ncbi:hypothetical protein AC578_8836 [Pseudocercospora eumusae]|uniref:Uncharacterized protein n=1 Tax=Pseudocercospora eumusae TaxID=321146 RepID=A0A139H4K9_9PEZI|nr:hypothetical protein AC578_8836 [Pseudocercospora eumusae]
MFEKYNAIDLRTAICGSNATALHPGEASLSREDICSGTKATGAAAAGLAPKMNTFMNFIRGPGFLQEQTSWDKTFHTRLQEAGEELIAHDLHWTWKSAMLMKQEISYLGGREWCETLEAAELESVLSAAFDECSELERRSVIDGEMVTWIARKK